MKGMAVINFSKSEASCCHQHHMHLWQASPGAGHSRRTPEGTAADPAVWLDLTALQPVSPSFVPLLIPWSSIEQLCCTDV